MDAFYLFCFLVAVGRTSSSLLSLSGESRLCFSCLGLRENVQLSPLSMVDALLEFEEIYLCS